LGLREGILPQEGCKTPEKLGFVGVSQGNLDLPAFDHDRTIDGGRGFREGRSSGLCGAGGWGSRGEGTVHTAYQPGSQEVCAMVVRSPVLRIGAGTGAVDGVRQFIPGLALHLDIARGQEGDRATADHRHCTGQASVAGASTA
jgi:hypothetical protein